MTIIVTAKRKTAIARAYIKEGNGKVTINSIPLQVYEPFLARLRISEPLILAGEDYISKVNIRVKVKGGGYMGKADAARIAIAKGLVKYFDDDKLKLLYLQYDPYMLKSDPRRKEQRKSPTSKARKHYTTAYR
ncbi:MAG: 30S ribosomal protein S9 [Candidatus Nanopusillus acidilobi]|jgi:small subunit ribosomal protein S9|nr:30S ribosomal protein S9 [Candidatus Nanopusillus sp.]MCG2868469.1 30S ribosomal protein S9 [Candidatus Nanopusillus sp.]MCG2882714.1 30S ribosomal protein S9 [Candidatus Nanopusillus sp.]